MTNSYEWETEDTARVRSIAANVALTEITGEGEVPVLYPAASRGDWDAAPTVVAGVPDPAIPDAQPASPPLYNGPLDEPSKSPATTTVDEQMDALLARSRFADASGPIVRTERRPVRTRRRFTFGRILVATVFVVLAGFATGVIGYGLRVKSTRQVTKLAEQIDGLSKGGALQSADGLLQRLGAHDLETADHALLVARTEALVYRYLDANPKRLATVQQKLKALGSAHADEATIIRAIVASHADRIAMLPELKRIAATSDDSEASFLVASALQRAGSHAQARRHFERSLDLEPSHLEHLAAYAEHELALGHLSAAENLLDTMREVSPTSSWTRFVASRLNRAESTDRHTIAPSPDDVVVPVAAAYARLFEAIERHASGEDGAMNGVEEAAKLVHRQAPFMTDFVDRLLDASWPAAARSVASGGGFTDETPGGAAALGRIVLAEGDAEVAAVMLSAVVEHGFKDPVTGVSHLSALRATGASHEQLRAVAGSLLAAWPDREDLAKLESQIRSPSEPSKTKKKRRSRRRR